MQTLFLLIILGLLTVPFAIFGLWWWFFTMLAIAVLVGLAELVAVLKTELTLSQMFWEWSKSNRAKAWIVIGCLFAVWVVLLVHMAWELL